MSQPDGNVHTVPMSGPDHIESKDCWCAPDLVGDYSDEGGAKHFVHKELQ